MGTPDFAVKSLEAIINENHDVSAVITKKDMPKGRGYKKVPSPIKVFAKSKNIKVLQPDNLKSEETIDALHKISPDIIVVAAYGKILPTNILNLPKFGCINVHASILPKYRGAAPIAWSIIKGEKKTGITIMQMDEGLDTGDIILQKKINISSDDNEASLRRKLSFIGADCIKKVLKDLGKNLIVEKKKQDNFLASFAPIINKKISYINWEKKATEIHNLIRGLNPWPCARTTLNKKLLKIHQAKVNNKSGLPGNIISTKPLLIGCASGSLEILKLQLENKKIMTSSEFICGNNVDGYRLI
jgi:methionyl-tRNA formyltransferase